MPNSPMRTVSVDTIIEYLQAAKAGGQTEVAHFEFHVRPDGLREQYHGDLGIWTNYQDKYGEIIAYIDSVPVGQVEEYGQTLHERINKRRRRHEIWKEKEATKRGHTLVPMRTLNPKLGAYTNFEVSR